MGNRYFFVPTKSGAAARDAWRRCQRLPNADSLCAPAYISSLRGPAKTLHQRAREARVYGLGGYIDGGLKSVLHFFNL